MKRVEHIDTTLMINTSRNETGKKTVSPLHGGKAHSSGFPFPFDDLSPASCANG